LCLQLGLTFNDFCNLKVGTIFDILVTNVNIQEEIKQKTKTNEGIREANKGENIMSFF